MEKLIEEQIKRTNLLMKSVEIVSICDNPRAQDLSREIKASMSKAEALLEKRRTILLRKKEVVGELEELTKKCNSLADQAEHINQAVFPSEQSYMSSLLEDSEQNTGTRQNMNSFEVSPCPSAWANGALDTPLPRGQRLVQSVLQEVETPQIKPLQGREMESVPAYMKGRLTCENVNAFVAVLNSVLKQKYSIVRLKRSEVKRKDLIQYCEWKSQEQEFKMIGQKFFTAEDLTNLGNYKMDKSSEKMTQTLRHTKRIRQTRVLGKVIVYILI